MPSFVETGPIVPEKKIFVGFLSYMDKVAILVMVLSLRCPDLTIYEGHSNNANWCAISSMLELYAFKSVSEYNKLNSIG